jgi:hypothetical protein
MVMRNPLPLLLITLFGLVASVEAAVSVRAQLERATIMAGETGILNVIVEGGSPQSAETFPTIAGLTMQYRGHSQNITSVNGQTSHKHLLNYSISASQPGQYTLPSIKVVVDGTPYSTQPVMLTVTKADVSAQNRYAFLRLNVPKQEVYVGEILPIELQLYVVDAENIQAPQLKSDSFIIHKQPEHTRSQAQVGNVLYSVLTFKMSVSAAKAGKLTFGPAEMSLVLRIRTRPDPNDIFGMFGRYERRPLAVSSPSVELNVLPLPSPAPPDFNGAIGSFTWTVSASPANVEVGDPITLKIAVSGRGNLDNLKPPEINWPGFKTYPPSSSVASDDPLGINGSKNFEQVIIPQSTAVAEVPALSLSYFDPAQKQYLKLTHPSTPLRIRPGTATANRPTVAGTESNDESAAEPDDIVHIKSSPGPLIALAPPLIRQPWFLALQLLPLIGVVSAAVWRKRQDHLANHPKLRRKIEVQRFVASGLVELRSVATANEPERFYALLFRLLQEQLGERLDLPASAITEAVLDERLPRGGAGPELIQELRYLFQICNQARYAPLRTDAELLSVAATLEKALSALQELPD